MPVTLINKLRENTYLIVWEITESNQQLQDLLHSRLHDWNAQAQHKENKHWLASRLAILHHFKNEEVDLVKDAFNKPHLKVDEKDVFVSISHSFDKAAVIISQNYPVSIDMERIDNRIERVMKKFCNDDELEMLPHCGEQQTALTVIWSAKETLYKWYAKKELDFKKHLWIEPFVIRDTPMMIRGRIKKESYTKELVIKVVIEKGYVTTFIV